MGKKKNKQQPIKLFDDELGGVWTIQNMAETQRALMGALAVLRDQLYDHKQALRDLQYAISDESIKKKNKGVPEKELPDFSLEQRLLYNVIDRLGRAADPLRTTNTHMDTALDDLEALQDALKYKVLEDLWL